jgi:hypothetical protein
MKISACIACGSKNIRSGTISDGVLPGYTDGLNTYVCDDCNHRGLPIVFETEEEYQKFLLAVTEDKESEQDK